MLITWDVLNAFTNNSLRIFKASCGPCAAPANDSKILLLCRFCTSDGMWFYYSDQDWLSCEMIAKPKARICWLYNESLCVLLFFKNSLKGDAILNRMRESHLLFLWNIILMYGLKCAKHSFLLSLIWHGIWWYIDIIIARFCSSLLF